MQRAAVPQRIGGKIQRESVGAEFVRQHVARMARVRADFEKRRHGADEVEMIANHRAAARVLFGVNPQVALRLAQGREVVKLHLRAFDRKWLRFRHFN